MGVLPQRHSECQPVGEQVKRPGNCAAQSRLCAGTCLVAPSAVQSSRTSCSSSWTIRDSVSTILTTSSFITVFTNAERNGDFSQLSDTAQESDHRAHLPRQPDSDFAGKPRGSSSLCLQVLSDTDQQQRRPITRSTKQRRPSTPIRAMRRSTGISPRTTVSAPVIRRLTRTTLRVTRC